MSRGDFTVPLIYGESATGAFGDTNAELRLGSNPALWGGPPSRFRERPLVGLPGSQITTVTHGARDIILPLTIRTDDTQTVDQVIARLMDGVDPVLQDDPVTFTYTSPYGTLNDRHIDAVLIGGQTGLSILHCEMRSAKVILAFRAEDPYWRSPERSDVLDFSGDVTPLWDEPTALWDDGAMWGPVYAESFDSGLIGEYGAVESWPTWEVDGPFTSFAARLGDLLLWFNGDVLDGETLEIVTDPARRSVTVNGANRYSDIDVRSTFWSFPPSTATPYIIGLEGNNNPPSASVRWYDKWLTCS